MLENEWFSICDFSRRTLFSKETTQKPREAEVLGLEWGAHVQPYWTTALPSQAHSRPLLVVLELTNTQLLPSGFVFGVVILRESFRVAVETV